MSATLQAGAAEGPVAAVRAPYLTISGLGKQFGSFTALRDINLQIAEGEFVSFLGPSGCGKTTLLRAIAGLDLPTEGQIIQGGRDVTALPPGARDFGIVFQSYALFPNLTVAANVGYGLRGAAWPRARRAERVAELIGIVGLPAHAKKYPAQLSGGEQRRVALARALASEPRLLLLDDPLSALDAIVRVHLREEIWSLQRQLGVTTIMVTHDQEEALSVSNRIVVMSAGRVEQIGTPEQIYADPASPFVAGFGTPVRVQIRPEDVRIVRSEQPGAVPARMTDVEFLGPFCRVELEAAGLTLQADVPTATLRALDLREGTAAFLVVPAAKPIVYPADV